MGIKTRSLHPALLALIALSLIWGYNWVVMKECLKYSAPFDFAAMRSFIGAFTLFAVMGWLRRPLRPKEIPMTMILGFLTTAGCIGLVTWALATGGVGKTAILVYIMPFWTLLLAWPILSERIYGMQWIAVVLAFAGLMIILEPWNLGGTFISKMLAVLSGIVWAVSAIFTKILRRKIKFDMLSLTAWQMFFGSLPLLVAALWVPSQPIQWTGYFAMGLIYSAVISQALALVLWFYILQELPAGTASLGTMATPVIGMLAASIKLGERPTILEGLGMLLILAGLGILAVQGIILYRQLKSPVRHTS